jgi:hypothetical protein
MGTLKNNVGGKFIMRSVWLTNTLHPEKVSPEILAQSEFGSDQPYAVWKQWLSDKALGEPQPIDGLSADDLKAQGYVGVYKCVLG